MRDDDSKEKCKRAGYLIQGDDCQCARNSRDGQSKSELETRMSKVATAQANCDFHCERARKKMCESNDVWKGEERREKANKMQKRGEERSLIEREGGGGEEEDDEEKRKRRTCGGTGRICNNKESCQKNIRKTLETPPTRWGVTLNSFSFPSKTTIKIS